MERTTRAIGSHGTAENKSTPVSTVKPAEPKDAGHPVGSRIGAMTTINEPSTVKHGD